MPDGVWTHGANTELDAWIAGESRRVIVTCDAVDEYLGLRPEQAIAMTAALRCKFVTDHLRTVIDAAKRKASSLDRAEDSITIRRGEL